MSDLKMVVFRDRPTPYYRKEYMQTVIMVNKAPGLIGEDNSESSKSVEKSIDSQRPAKTETTGTKTKATRSPADLQAVAQEYLEREAAREKQRARRRIREYIKRVAEERNFKAVIEESVRDCGKIDVGLLKDDLRIACEVSVTNAEYDVQNIRKCLEAGYLLVFMVSNDLAHIEAIRNMAVSQIELSYHNRILFVSEEDFVPNLDRLSSSRPSTETRVKGYKVKLNFNASSDQQTRQEILRSIMLAAITRSQPEN